MAQASGITHTNKTPCVKAEKSTSEERTMVEDDDLNRKRGPTNDRTNERTIELLKEIEMLLGGRRTQARSLPCVAKGQSKRRRTDRGAGAGHSSQRGRSGSGHERRPLP